MDDKIKYILFNPADSLYGEAFKFHRFKEILLISLLSFEESIEWSEKRFPGDDREQIILDTKKGLYFKIGDKLMEDRLKSIINTTEEILFAYKTSSKINTKDLIDFHFFADINQNSHYNYSKFPSKIQRDNDNIIGKLYNDEEINWDDLG
jgi:hypothetical protein